MLQGNQFVEGLVPHAIMRTLDDDEWAEYLRPWTTAGEDRRPTLTWPRQIPIDGEPADVHATIEAIAQFLSATTIPKPFINVEPGLAVTDRERRLRRDLPQPDGGDGQGPALRPGARDRRRERRVRRPALGSRAGSCTPEGGPG